MNKYLSTAFIIILLVLLGALIAISTGRLPEEEQNEQPAVRSDEDLAVVAYTEEGFQPETATITAGQTVRFINQSSRGMWVASNDHPIHEELPGFDQRVVLGENGVYEYTFQKSGRWGYHNHVRPGDGGEIIVK